MRDTAPVVLQQKGHPKRQKRRRSAFSLLFLSGLALLACRVVAVLAVGAV